MRRRDFLLLPAGAGILDADLGRIPPVVTLRLNEEDPFAALDRKWIYGRPVRVVARAHGAWWPSAQDLPNAWQAWIETDRGARVVVVCMRRASRTPARPGVAMDVWRQLSAGAASAA